MSEELIPGVMKNIDAKTVVTLKDQVACLPGQVI
ncbi:MAG: cupin domain-containing protein, partial [Atopobium sp.]|nr:cupin domain-containing protein [Atopobium sp.]